MRKYNFSSESEGEPEQFETEQKQIEECLRILSRIISRIISQKSQEIGHESEQI